MEENTDPKEHLQVIYEGGTTIVIPDIHGFLKDTGGRALFVDEFQDVYILRAGPKKGSYRWVSVVEDGE